ncbi:MAG TPA: BLUF domain-containing protein [Caulobacteraceae bacterium]|nr:BLUF domain-containing protein [Caulobacteraceae bacterium]
MHRLIYASRFTARFPLERGEQDYALNAIIRASTRNNRATDITGLLLTYQRQVLQVLEGPRDALAAAYERILKDPRHDGAKLIVMEEAAGRAFGDWGLLALRVNRGDNAMVDRLEAAHETFAALSPADAFQLLAEVRDVQAHNLLAAMA